MEHEVYIYEDDGIWQATRSHVGVFVDEADNIMAGVDVTEYGAIVELLNKEAVRDKRDLVA